MTTEAPRTSTQENISKLGELIKDIEIAMMTTADPDGSMRSRPMATMSKDFDGELWFFTSNKSGKIVSLHNDQHVNLAYAEPKSQKYVSVSGRAEISQDKKKMKELWTPAMKAWFPKGLEDPEICLLRVRVESAEYWDSPSSKLVHLVGFAKAALTGQRADIGENERLDINPQQIH